jgi:hypothetical protein
VPTINLTDDELKSHPMGGYACCENESGNACASAGSATRKSASVGS